MGRLQGNIKTFAVNLGMCGAITTLKPKGTKQKHVTELNGGVLCRKSHLEQISDFQSKDTASQLVPLGGSLTLLPSFDPLLGPPTDHPS